MTEFWVAGGRMVLALAPDGASEPGLRAAAEIARCLRLDWLVLFLEDERALGAAAAPGATEFGAEGQPPRRIEPAALERDFGLLARRTERRVLDIARAAAIDAAFERLRGRPELALPQRLGRGDLLTVFEPARPGDRALGPHAALARAPGSARAVLRVPARLNLPGGAVAALAEAADEATPALAAALARAMNAPLALMRAGARPGSAAGPERAEDAALRLALAGGARLLILGPGLRRGPRIDALLGLARLSRTPVLALSGLAEPDGEGA